MPKRKASVAEVPSENEDVLDGGNNSDTPLNKASPDLKYLTDRY